MARARSGSAPSSAPSPEDATDDAAASPTTAGGPKGAKRSKTAKPARNAEASPPAASKPSVATSEAEPDGAAAGQQSATPELLAATDVGGQGRNVVADVSPEAFPMTAEIAIVDASSLLDDFGAAPVAAPSRPPKQLAGAPEVPRRLPAALDRPDIHADGPAVRVPSPKARRAARRLVARKVGRIVRHVDPWSVLKVALLFNLFAFLISLVCAVLLWQLVSSFGVITDIEGFITEAFALESFAFSGRQIFRIVATGGLLLAIAATAGAVLLAVVFNLVSDLTGGIRVSVVEEETARSLQPRG